MLERKAMYTKKAMFVSNILKSLENVAQKSELELPVIIVPQPEAYISEEDFLKSIGDKLKQIKPSRITLILWPFYEMQKSDVHKLLRFICQHVQCPIRLNFSNQSQSWIASFYEYAKEFVDPLKVKPIISCIGADNNAEWCKKFFTMSGIDTTSRKPPRSNSPTILSSTEIMNAIIVPSRPPSTELPTIAESIPEVETPAPLRINRPAGLFSPKPRPAIGYGEYTDMVATPTSVMMKRRLDSVSEDDENEVARKTPDIEQIENLLKM